MNTIKPCPKMAKPSFPLKSSSSNARYRYNKGPTIGPVKRPSLAPQSQQFIPTIPLHSLSKPHTHEHDCHTHHEQ